MSVARQGRERRKLEEDNEEEEEVEAEDKDERSSSLLVWRELGFHRREGKELGGKIRLWSSFRVSIFIPKGSGWTIDASWKKEKRKEPR